MKKQLILTAFKIGLAVWWKGVMYIYLTESKRVVKGDKNMSVDEALREIGI